MIKLIAIIGEAGTGKDFVTRLLVQQHPDLLSPIISCTTRPKRENEKDGINYYFLTEEQFQEKISSGQMLEYTMFNNWFYGTTNNSLSKDKINIGVFNPDGIRNIQRYSEIKLLTIRLVISKKIRLLRQLKREENPDVDEIVRRYITDSIDFKKELLDFEYLSMPSETYDDVNMIFDEIMKWTNQIN